VEQQDTLRASVKDCEEALLVAQLVAAATLEPDVRSSRQVSIPPALMKELLLLAKVIGEGAFGTAYLLTVAPGTAHEVYLVAKTVKQSSQANAYATPAASHAAFTDFGAACEHSFGTPQHREVSGHRAS
jgi:hypothetical protein